LSPKSIVVIGGGIVGLATSYRLGQRFPDARITVLEKEAAVGQHQSGHNSGVLHAGIYYKPGSIKARLAVRGIRQMVEFCEENQVPHVICGKLVVASNESELPPLHALFDRGRQNGLRGLEILDLSQMKEVEPYVTGVAAIRVPEEGIVDYPAVCAALSGRIRGSVITRAQVVRLRENKGTWIVESTSGEFKCDLLINCAGLHSDRISRLAGLQPGVRIVPFRGEYYKLKPASQHLVRNLIYPVPDPKFPFLGLHFTRMIHGGVEAGPNAVLAFAREGYRKSDVNFADLADSLTFPGFWAFLRRYPGICLAELRRSFSKQQFCRALQKLVPSITIEDLEPGGSGVRAQALDPSGRLIQDFCILRHANSVHVLNAPSPAATASLAIGEEIVSSLKET
jgi:L-2-hydroxyglutarate oxidase